MIGETYAWYPGPRFAVLIGQDGLEYFCPVSQIRPTEFNERFLQVGEAVEFNTRKKLPEHRRPAATNVVPDRLKEILYPPKDYRAEWQVVKLPGNGITKGMACRPGERDWVGWYSAEIISELPRDFKIEVGVTRFWAGLVRSEEDPSKFYLREIEVIKTE